MPHSVEPLLSASSGVLFGEALSSVGVGVESAGPEFGAASSSEGDPDGVEDSSVDGEVELLPEFWPVEGVLDGVLSSVAPPEEDSLPEFYEVELLPLEVELEVVLEPEFPLKSGLNPVFWSLLIYFLATSLIVSELLMTMMLRTKTMNRVKKRYFLPLFGGPEPFF